MTAIRRSRRVPTLPVVLLAAEQLAHIDARRIEPILLNGRAYEHARVEVKFGNKVILSTGAS